MGVSPIHIAVVGAGDDDAPTGVLAAAEAVGRAVGEAGAVLVCGGRGGVMEAACRGARAVGGLTVGILPGSDPAEANPYVEVVVPTGLGEARNALVVRAGDAVVAVDGGYGTLSEIALALVAGIPVVGIRTWELARDGKPDEGIERVDDPAGAVALALARGRDRGSDRS
jgi:uncharacterized protein (TIGR00725 family)